MLGTSPTRNQIGDSRRQHWVMNIANLLDIDPFDVVIPEDIEASAIYDDFVSRDITNVKQLLVEWLTGVISKDSIGELTRAFYYEAGAIAKFFLLPAARSNYMELLHCVRKFENPTAIKLEYVGVNSNLEKIVKKPIVYMDSWAMYGSEIPPVEKTVTIISTKEYTIKSLEFYEALLLGADTNLSSGQAIVFKNMVQTSTVRKLYSSLSVESEDSEYLTVTNLAVVNEISDAKSMYTAFVGCKAEGIRAVNISEGSTIQMHIAQTLFAWLAGMSAVRLTGNTHTNLMDVFELSSTPREFMDKCRHQGIDTGSVFDIFA